MQQDCLLSALIGDIYDAALDPARWQTVLARVARFVGGASATLLQALLTTPRGYYVDLTTSANTGGALRDQLDSPDRR